MPESVDVGDRLTPSSQHRCDIQPDPTAVMQRGETAPSQSSRHRAVSPTRSARSRTATAPANGTTPDPSAVTDNPRDHKVGFTREMPSRQEESNPKQVRFSLICKALP